MSVMSNRNGENGLHPIRNQRFFQMDNYWYYTTREGVNVGPFDSCVQAQRGVVDFIEYICTADDRIVQAFKQCARAAA